MPTITITFDYPQACVPKYKFGDRIAVKENCHPMHWLTGEVIGLTLETEIFKPCWSYNIKLDLPVGYTEEHTESELVPEVETQQQAELTDGKSIVNQRNNQKKMPKFQPGMRVRLSAESGGFQDLIKDFALVVSSKYVSNKSWSGWIYKLITKNLAKPIEIGEIWLELAPTTTEATDKHPVSK